MKLIVSEVNLSAARANLAESHVQIKQLERTNKILVGVGTAIGFSLGLYSLFSKSKIPASNVTPISSSQLAPRM